MSDTTWVVRDAEGRIVALSDYRTSTEKGHTITLTDRAEGCRLAHSEWFPNCTKDHQR